MSSHRHPSPVQFRIKPAVLGASLVSAIILTACAGPSTTDQGAAHAETPASGLDQYPIDAPVTKVNIANLPTEQAAAPEESDMTVLVLEDRHLLALASRMSPPANLSETAPERPDVAQFQFAFDAHRLDARAEAVLRQHGQYLEANPNQKVQLNGHADAQGADPYNRFLSRLRASAAARILKQEGAREEQIEVQAFGSDRPLAEGDHEVNRRLELIYGAGQLAMGK